MHLIFLSPGQSLVPESTHQVAQTESGAAAGQTGQTGLGCSAEKSRISRTRRWRRWGVFRLRRGYWRVWWLPRPLLTPLDLWWKKTFAHTAEKGDFYLQLRIFNRCIVIYLISCIYCSLMSSLGFSFVHLNEIFRNIFYDINFETLSCPLFFHWELERSHKLKVICQNTHYKRCGPTLTKQKKKFRLFLVRDSFYISTLIMNVYQQISFRNWVNSEKKPSLLSNVSQSNNHCALWPLLIALLISVCLVWVRGRHVKPFPPRFDLTLSQGHIRVPLWFNLSK